MIIILKTLVDIYKPQTRSDIIPKIVKRNVECKKSFESNAISVEQYIKPNGDISKKWCNVKEGDSYYRVNHSFDYMHKLLAPLYISWYKRWEI
jgi:hypothetical protein